MTMRLIGKLDSPFVRRVAVSLHLQGLAFVHENLSVFGDYPAFADINPVVKAPTLVLDDGTVLLDSTLILEVVERMAAPDLRLAPQDLKVFAQHQRISGWRWRLAKKPSRSLSKKSFGRLRSSMNPGWGASAISSRPPITCLTRLS